AEGEHRDHEGGADCPAHQGKVWCTSGRIWAQSGKTTLWPAANPSDVYGGTSTTRWMFEPLKSFAIDSSGRSLSTPMLLLISPLKALARVGRSATFKCEAWALMDSSSCCWRSDRAKSPRTSPWRERTYFNA